MGLREKIHSLPGPSVSIDEVLGNTLVFLMGGTKKSLGRGRLWVGLAWRLRGREKGGHLQGQRSEDTPGHEVGTCPCLEIDQGGGLGQGSRELLRAKEGLLWVVDLAQAAAESALPGP